MSLKRYRDAPPSPSPSPSPPAKLSHLPTPLPYPCTLPPTCHLHHTHYQSPYHLERHHDIFHRWVCTAPVRVRDEHPEHIPESFAAQKGCKKWRECLKVFPEARLLDLHYTETHDPIARERQKNGEKIFECFLPPDQCGKVFTNPKNRRLHMISKHKYPTQYFWSITNHGINEIARQDGLGFSLIRPKPDLDSVPKFSGGADGEEEGEDEEGRGRGHHGQPRGPPRTPPPVLRGSLSQSPSPSLPPLSPPSNLNSKPRARAKAKAKNDQPFSLQTTRQDDPASQDDGDGYKASGEQGKASREQGGEGREGEGQGDIEMEDLTRAMSSMESSLSFLPRGVRKTKSGRERRGGRGRNVKVGGLGLDV